MNKDGSIYREREREGGRARYYINIMKHMYDLYIHILYSVYYIRVCTRAREKIF